jgi:hypothetical protein
MSRPVTLMDIKLALRDHRFRELFPELKSELDRAIAQPHCGSCSTPVAREILRRYGSRLADYFPGRPILSENGVSGDTDYHWKVYNGACAELEDWLRKLPPGSAKQVAIARDGTDCTCVVGEVISD